MDATLQGTGTVFGSPRTLRGPAALLFAAGALASAAAGAAQFTINGPPGSGAFGSRVTVLPSGNLVVCDPEYDAPGPIVDVGAVHLYRPDGTLVNTLRGGSANDRVGSEGVVVLPSGAYVVLSPSWRNGTATDAGAVTFVPGFDGIDGIVTPDNSLVGGSAGDRVGSGGLVALTNGNFVVRSPEWDNGPLVNAGAVTFVATFGPGNPGISGLVSVSNSLVGGTANDQVGQGDVTPLANGNYVVAIPRWDSGASADAGAVTFGSGLTGVSGLVSAGNSLVGGSAFDRVGDPGVTALASGNYVVSSRLWDQGATADVGAATFGSGGTGVAGLVSTGNSLVGTSAGDRVGERGVLALSNGNYVVLSPRWDNGAAIDAGAATFGPGNSGLVGAVSPGNSLVGTTTNDFVAEGGAVALASGNYVVVSAFWDDPPTTTDAGAVTFGFGATGVSGPVSGANSLVGGAAGDRVGANSVFALASGNYVVASASWDNGSAVDAGAATFGDGGAGIVGTVSPQNSLVGGSAWDRLGDYGVTPLANGNYVVPTPFWDSATAFDVGAATFGSGATGITGLVSPANSLVGSQTSDRVGLGRVTALSDGDYVVLSGSWRNGAVIDAGAATFGSGSNGISGAVSPANSLVGSTLGDEVGGFGTVALADGGYVVASSRWDNGTATDAGAMTFGSGSTGVSGPVSAANSLVGLATDDQIGQAGAVALPNGNYFVVSTDWDNGPVVDAGAITLGLSNGTVRGPITSEHSVLGPAANGGRQMTASYDPVRNQLVVGQLAVNRVVLHRTGVETSTSLAVVGPDPALAGQPVAFTAVVAATPSAPTDGRVTFSTSTGETCTDTTPTPVSPTTAAYACTLTFFSAGTRAVVAEYTGSIIHAFSRSGPAIHTTIVPLFVDGFEGP